MSESNKPFRTELNDNGIQLLITLNNNHRVDIEDMLKDDNHDRVKYNNLLKSVKENQELLEQNYNNE